MNRYNFYNGGEIPGSLPYKGNSIYEIVQQLGTRLEELDGNCLKETNEVKNLINWVKNKGITQEVNNKLIELVNNGTMEKLIDVTTLGNLNGKISDILDTMATLSMLDLYRKKSSKIDMSDLSEDLKLSMSNGNVAVVGSGSVFNSALQDQCVSPSKLLYTGQIRNKGIRYPVMWSGDKISNPLLNGILDIKIINALPNCYYRLKYITNSHNKLGDTILIDRINTLTNKTTALFNSITSKYPINHNGINTLRLKAEKGQEIVLLSVDYSEIPLNFSPDVSSTDSPYNTNVISQDCYYCNEFYDTNNTVNISDGLIDFQINVNKDFKARLGIKNTSKGNHLPDFVILGMQNKINDTFTSLGTGSTDWFSPYMIMALKNLDGNSQSINEMTFTGGYHLYNNLSEGATETARNIYLKCYVDGIEQTSYNSNFKTLKIEWVNRIQASNTKRIDGDGREVLEEKITLNISDLTESNIEVTKEIKALEDIKLYKHYGIQTFLGKWSNPKLFFNSSDNKNEIDAITGGTSISEYCDSINISSDNCNMIVGIDKTYGLGKNTIVDSKVPGATASNSKTYFNLINKKDGYLLKQGEVLKMKGYYKIFK